ncbi:MAG: hypothetical protein DWH81_11400 [Planctomycetota bacterium]|nr:MAG: hypothetical protein DWH81_11400 [Planctomycetota bacterium]
MISCQFSVQQRVAGVSLPCPHSVSHTLKSQLVKVLSQFSQLGTLNLSVRSVISATSCQPKVCRSRI